MIGVVRKAYAAVAGALQIRRSNVTRSSPQRDPLTETFIPWLRSVRHARVMELGTRRSNPNVSTMHGDWLAPDATLIGVDFETGLDVDVVADAERLTEVFEPASFDAVIACSVFEHIRKPWKAAVEIGKVLRPGGRVFVQTHFAFPIHAYPYDYWRFTREALETLFDAEAGFGTIASYYDFPCKIVSDRVPQTADAEAYLNVCIIAERM